MIPVAGTNQCIVELDRCGRDISLALAEKIAALNEGCPEAILAAERYLADAVARADEWLAE